MATPPTGKSPISSRPAAAPAPGIDPKTTNPSPHSPSATLPGNRVGASAFGMARTALPHPGAASASAFRTRMPRPEVMSSFHRLARGEARRPYMMFTQPVAERRELPPEVKRDLDLFLASFPVDKDKNVRPLKSLSRFTPFQLSLKEMITQALTAKAKTPTSTDADELGREFCASAEVIDPTYQPVPGKPKEVLRWTQAHLELVRKAYANLQAHEEKIREHLAGRDSQDYTYAQYRAIATLISHWTTAGSKGGDHSLASTKPGFQKVLVANRGEIALRIIRGAKKAGIPVAFTFSDSDAKLQWVKRAKTMGAEGVPIGGIKPKESYLVIDKILAAAKKVEADALHPGYGFLSERPDFARALRKAGVVLWGPSPEAMEMAGDKDSSKQKFIEAGVPVIPGTVRGYLEVEGLLAEIDSRPDLKFPLRLKAVAGGGGKGQKTVHNLEELRREFPRLVEEAKAAFGNGHVFAELFMPRFIHIELQGLADSFGNVVNLGERECTNQKRAQKLAEASRAPDWLYERYPELAEQMTAAMVKAARAVGYTGHGTFEFMVDPDTGKFYLMEVNTRIQVEHAVTELTTGVDIVQEQIRISQGLPLSIRQEDVQQQGVALQIRLTQPPETLKVKRIREFSVLGVEDFSPDSPGFQSLEEQHIFVQPTVSTADGDDELNVSSDAMFAKIVLWAPTRVEVFQKAIEVLEQTRARGWSVLVEGSEGYKPIDDGAEIPFGDTSFEVTLNDEQIFINEGMGSQTIDLVALMQKPQKIVWKNVDGETVELQLTGVQRQGQSSPKIVLTFPQDSTKRYEFSYEAAATDIASQLALFKRQAVRKGHYDNTFVERTLELGGEDFSNFPHTKRAGSSDRGLLKIVSHHPIIDHEVADSIVAFQDWVANKKDSHESLGPISELVFRNRPRDFNPSEQILAQADDQGQLRQVVITEDRRVRQIFLRLDAYDAPQDVGRIDLTAPEGQQVQRFTVGADGLLVPASEPMSLAEAGLVLESVSANLSTAYQLRDAQGNYLLTMEPQELVFQDHERLLVLFDFIINQKKLLPSPLQKPIERELLSLLNRLAKLPAGHAERNAAVQLLGRTPISLVQELVKRAIGEGPSPLRELLDEITACREVEGQTLRHRMLGYRPIDADFSVATVMDSSQGTPFPRLLVRGYHPAGTGLAATLKASLAHLDAVVEATKAEPVERSTPDWSLARDHVIQIVVPLAPGAQVDETYRTTVRLQVKTLLDYTVDFGKTPLKRVTLILQSTDKKEYPNYLHYRPKLDAQGDYTGEFEEETRLRDVHPMLAHNIGLDRYAEFETERDLERSNRTTHVYRVENAKAKDRRLAGMGLVRDGSVEGEGSIDEAMAQLALAMRAKIKEAEDAAKAKADAEGKEKPDDHGLHWNEILINVQATQTRTAEDFAEELRQKCVALYPILNPAELERILVRANLQDPNTGVVQEVVVELRNPTGFAYYDMQVKPAATAREKVKPRSADERQFLEREHKGRRLSGIWAYRLPTLINKVADRLCGEWGAEPLPGFQNSFQELDLDPETPINVKTNAVDYNQASGRLIPVDRPLGQNKAGVVVGLQTVDLGIGKPVETLVIIGDFSHADNGSLSHAECARINAAIALAKEKGISITWYPASSGAGIRKPPIKEGADALSAIAATAREIVRNCHSLGVPLNVIVASTNIGGQSYWDSLATIIHDTGGMLIMTPDGSTALTGADAFMPAFFKEIHPLDLKKATKSFYPGGTKDLASYAKIHGPNGEAGAVEPTVEAATERALRHLYFSHTPIGQLVRKRILGSDDPVDRDITQAVVEETKGSEKVRVNIAEQLEKILGSSKGNVRAVIEALSDIGAPKPLYWWQDAKGSPDLRAFAEKVLNEMEAKFWDEGKIKVKVRDDVREALKARQSEVRQEIMSKYKGHMFQTFGAVVAEAQIGGRPTMVIVPPVGPLTPMDSLIIARALWKANGRMPVVVMGSLTGFYPDPASMTNAQLFAGASIAEAIIKHRGPITVVNLGMIVGGSEVVVDKQLNPLLTALANALARVQVIGGASAAKVVFMSAILKEAAERIQANDELVQEALRELEAKAPEQESGKKFGEDATALFRLIVAKIAARKGAEYDATHTVELAKLVGTVDRIFTSNRLRPEIIAANEDGVAAYEALLLEEAARAELEAYQRVFGDAADRVIAGIKNYVGDAATLGPRLAEAALTVIAPRRVPVTEILLKSPYIESSDVVLAEDGKTRSFKFKIKDFGAGRYNHVTGNTHLSNRGIVTPAMEFAANHPLTAQVVEEMLAKNPDLAQHKVLHGRENIEYLAPVPLDEELEVRASHSLRVVKGQGLLFIDRQIFDATQTLVAKSRTALLLVPPEAELPAPPKANPADSGELVATHVVHETLPGEFSLVSGDYNRVHQGPDAILHGMALLNFAEAAYRERFHAAEKDLRFAMETKFSGVVRLNDTVRFFVKPGEKSTKVFALNQRDELVLEMEVKEAGKVPLGAPGSDWKTKTLRLYDQVILAKETELAVEREHWKAPPAEIAKREATIRGLKAIRDQIAILEFASVLQRAPEQAVDALVEGLKAASLPFEEIRQRLAQMAGIVSAVRMAFPDPAAAAVSEDPQVRGPQLLIPKQLPLAGNQVVVTIGEGMGYAADGSLKISRAEMMGDPEAIGRKAEEARKVVFVGVEKVGGHTVTIWNDRETGKRVSLEEIQTRWGAELRAKSGIRVLPRLPNPDQSIPVTLKLYENAIVEGEARLAIAQESQASSQEIEEQEKWLRGLHAHHDRLSKHPVDSLVADFGGLVPDYVSDDFLGFMGMRAKDLAGTRFGGAMHRFTVENASRQAYLYLMSAMATLNQLGGTLPGLYPHPRKVGWGFGASFEAWDKIVELLEAHRNHVKYAGFGTPLPHALMGTPIAILANLLAPPFNYSMLKRDPKALEGIVPPNMHPRVGPRTMGPAYTETAACASAAYALSVAAARLTGQIPGQFVPDVMLIGAADASLAPSHNPLLVTGFPTPASLTTETLVKNGWSPAQGLRPLTNGAAGVGYAEGSVFFMATRLDALVERMQRGAAIVAGYDVSLGEGGKEHLTGIDEGTVAALLSSILMAVDGHGMSPADIKVIQGHLTNTKLNNLAELVSIDKVLAACAKYYNLDPIRPYINALKAKIAHSMGNASGADILMAIMTLVEQKAPPLYNFDPNDLDERYAKHGIDQSVRFPTQAVLEEIEAVAIGSAGFGSRAGGVVLKRFDPQHIRRYIWPSDWRKKVDRYVDAWSDIVAQYDEDQAAWRAGKVTSRELLERNAYSNSAVKR